jgi:hypothetical protein
MRAVRLLPIVLILAAACGGDGSPEVTDSGIEGVTFSGPQCPVEVAGSPCPDAPISIALYITRRGGTDVVATTRSDAEGRFRVKLAPGEYTIHPLETSGPPTAAPLDVTVRRGAYTRVTMAFDSGIR